MLIQKILQILRLAHLTIVRRYVDMNGRYVGELYVDGKMIGASLDNLPLGYAGGYAWRLDMKKSFLEPLGWRTLRVGGLEPQDDAFVRSRAKSLRFRPIRLEVLNRFVEHVLQESK